MLNSELNDERALRFALGKLARDDRFCTGAGFIIYKMRRLLRPDLIGARNKNTFPDAFRFQMIKFDSVLIYFFYHRDTEFKRNTEITPV